MSNVKACAPLRDPGKGLPRRCALVVFPSILHFLPGTAVVVLFLLVFPGFLRFAPPHKHSFEQWMPIILECAVRLCKTEDLTHNNRFASAKCTLVNRVWPME